MSYNRVIILGRLGKDPEVRYTQGGLTVANLRLATNERRPDGNGGWKEETEWHSVVLFGKQADTAKQYLTKGREVLIEGSLRTRQWQDKDGQKRYSTEIVAQTVQMLGPRTGADRGPDDVAATVPPEEHMGADSGPGPGNDDDIPF